MTKLLPVIIIFILYACHPDKQKEVSLTELNFQTTDQSEIYFKNVRRSYYNLEELPDAAIEVYTLPEYQEIYFSYLTPQITYNWRNDFAAIMLKLSPQLENQQAITLIIETKDQEEKILVNLDNIKTQSTIAVKLYNAILRGDQIYVVIERQKQPLFASDEEKNNFRITIFDFLRLVELR